MSLRTNRKTGGIFKVPEGSLLERHIYSYRDYPIGEFAAAYKIATANQDYELQTKIREKYRQMESKRIWNSMNDLHKMFAALDPDERELFKARNPEIMRMINEWAVVEDLGEF